MREDLGDARRGEGVMVGCEGNVGVFVQDIDGGVEHDREGRMLMHKEEVAACTAI